MFTFGAIGIYFDGFLRDSDLENTKKKVLRAYTRIQYDKTTFENNLQDATSFMNTEESFIASVDLINNYQDKQDQTTKPSEDQQPSSQPESQPSSQEQDKKDQQKKEEDRDPEDDLRVVAHGLEHGRDSPGNVPGTLTGPQG